MLNQTIQIISWNVRELNNALKMQSVFDYVASFHPSLVCLQEIHTTGITTRFLKVACSTSSSLSLNLPLEGGFYSSLYGCFVLLQ